MPKHIVIKHIPSDEVEEMEEIFESLGAKDVTKHDNGDGTADLEGTLPDKTQQASAQL